jgi:hypothetical protein
MNKQFIKQILIALVLFLLGYFSFNNKLFAAQKVPMNLSTNLSMQISANGQETA